MDSNTSIDCPARDHIRAGCPCPKEDCPRHGICCECLTYHKGRIGDPVLKRLPACLRDMVREAFER